MAENHKIWKRFIHTYFIHHASSIRGIYSDRIHSNNFLSILESWKMAALPVAHMASLLKILTSWFHSCINLRFCWRSISGRWQQPTNVFFNLPLFHSFCSENLLQDFIWRISFDLNRILKSSKSNGVMFPVELFVLG